LRPILKRQRSTETSWIPKRQVYLFLNAIAEGENIPELGFTVGELITPDSLGAIGESMAPAKTLAEAVRIFCRLINRHAEIIKAG
jgi:hypothetical protein